MAEKEPLAEALRAQIIKLATDGEKESGALSADILLRIMRVAKTGRELLVSLAATPSNLSSMIARPQSPFAPVGLSDSESDGMAGNSYMTSAMPFASAPMPENFGMTVIRELMSAAKNLNGSNSPAKLVEALAIAKEKGLHDVAEELERQLGVKKELVVVERAEEPKKENGQ